jgi:cobaltochelatase CobN
MGKIVFLTNIERQCHMLEQAHADLARQGCLQSEIEIFRFNEATPWGTEWPKTLSASDLVIITRMGGGPDTKFLQKIIIFLNNQQIPNVMLLSDSNSADIRQGVSDSDRETIQKYLQYAGPDNYCQFWLWLSHRYCREATDYLPPQPLLWQGIYHPGFGSPCTDSVEYRRHYCQAGRPTVGVLFYRDEWVWGDLAYQNVLIMELEAQNLNVLAVFSPGRADLQSAMPGLTEAILNFFCEDRQPTIDVLINTMKFSLTATRGTDLQTLQRLNVPVLQAYTLRSSREEWRNSSEGISATEVAFSVTLPEFDGVVHSVPVAGKEDGGEGQSCYIPIRERIKLLARKAGKWAALRFKANAAKKVAVILHNYPPANSNLGSAAGLDSPESVRRILAALQEQGYRVDHIPADSRSLMAELGQRATNDRRFLTDIRIRQAAGKLTCDQYQRFFAVLPAPTRTRIIHDWGEPPGKFFYYDEGFLIPGVLNGNILITVQPPRGFGANPGQILHAPDCAPPHYYLAYYHWLSDIWQADAVIHVGTHGSLEWLPGKRAALSDQCYPDLALGNLPNIYPYWVTIVGEGLQAKRRSAACLIGYQTPPLSNAGTYAELAELEQLVEEYCHFQQNQPSNVAAVRDLIRQKAADAHFQDDLPEQPGEAFDAYVQRLHVYLTDLKTMQIRVGLHVLGNPPRDETLVEYLLALTQTEADDHASLNRTLAAGYGLNYDELMTQCGRLLPDGSKTYGAVLTEIREHSRELIRSLAQRDFAEAEADTVLKFDWSAALDQNLRRQLVEISRYICRTLAPRLAETGQEMTNLLAALDGRYIEPGPGGAPTSGMTDVLPTGRNFYGADPRALPTPAAWEIGRKMGDDVIQRYINEEGRYPESVGIVIWATSNLRSHGQCLAEFLYLIGVRPVWQRGGRRVIDLEMIPLAELKRPRIDVTGRISGLFRDSMPMAVDWLDQAVKLAVEADESPDQNYLRKHALQEAKLLEENGVAAVEAWEQACYRLFGDPPGAYGAGIGAALEAQNWTTVADLAAVYLRWGGHAYGVNAQGVFQPELFRRRLSGLDVTIQNRDNREVSIMNSDDYNAYHGGMIAAVRSLKGAAPRSYCGDSSDRNNVALRSLGEEITRWVRGEAVNPKFIAGMKKHGYKGAADLADYVAHSFQWDATSAVMADWMYQEFAAKYALDTTVREWMKEVNPWALQRIAATLLEAEQRGLWQADPQIKAELQQIYLAIDGELETAGDE